MHIVKTPMIRIKVSYNCNMLLVKKLYLLSDISFCTLVKLLLVQSFYSWTGNKLQEKVSQLFPIQKNVLYNVLKVLRNPAKERP